jgi:GNAT superfamily N-acetyltransferase
LVADGVVPGLIGYLDGKPVGWISLGPRTDYRRFAAMQSDKFQPVDDQPVWSIVCFFVAREARGKGVAQSMLSGAIDYARAHAVPRLEAYPVDVGQRVAPANVYMGTAALFEHAGFIEVARRDPARPIMRLELVK